MRSKGVNELIVACERERIQTCSLDEPDDLIKGARSDLADVEASHIRKAATSVGTPAELVVSWATVQLDQIPGTEVKDHPQITAAFLSSDAVVVKSTHGITKNESVWPFKASEEVNALLTTGS